MEAELNNMVNGPPAGTPAGTPPATTAGTPAVMDKETEKIGLLMRELIAANTNLVIKVATCRCNNKENCKVYKEAQKIAEIIDKLNETRS